MRDVIVAIVLTVLGLFGCYWISYLISRGWKDGQK